MNVVEEAPLGLDRTRWPELLLGLEGVRVLEVARDGERRLHVAIETTDELTACAECGVRAVLKDRAPVGFADLPAFGSPVCLVWVKRRWSCAEAACGAQTWTEQRPDIAPARAVLTTRAGLWGAPDLARQWLDALTADCRTGTGPEVRGMARTLVQWREAILAWHTCGYTNGPVEGLNALIKKIKRVATGFRSFTNYRLRILLAVGGCNWALPGTPPR